MNARKWNNVTEKHSPELFAMVKSETRAWLNYYALASQMNEGPLEHRLSATTRNMNKLNRLLRRAQKITEQVNQIAHKLGYER